MNAKGNPCFMQVYTLISLSVFALLADFERLTSAFWRVRFGSKTKASLVLTVLVRLNPDNYAKQITGVNRKLYIKSNSDYDS